MGKVTSGEMKGVSGRMGEIIYYNVDGKTYTRKMPAATRAGSTPDKMLQHARMEAVVTLYRSVKATLLETAWRMAAKQEKTRTGYHLFVKRNINAYTDGYQVGDFGLLTLSAGRLPIPYRWRQEAAEAGQLVSHWDTVMPLAGGNETDRLMAAVIYDDEPFRVEIIRETGYTRADGSATIPLTSTTAREAHVYCFFVNREEDAFSRDVYFHVQLA